MTDSIKLAQEIADLLNGHPTADVLLAIERIVYAIVMSSEDPGNTAETFIGRMTINLAEPLGIEIDIGPDRDAN